MQTLLVTGVGGPAGRNLAGLLVENGYQVVGVDMQDLQHDHVAGIAFRQVAAAGDPQYLPQLRQLALEYQVGLLIPTVSEELPLLAQLADTLPVPVALSGLDSIVTAHDKYLTWQHLSQQDIPVPATLLAPLESAEAVRRLGLPFISKPRTGRGGRGVKVHFHAQEIRELPADSLLQSFASGTEYTVNLHCGSGFADAVIVVLEKTELKDGLVGNAVRVKRVEALDVLAVARRTARSLQLRGLIDMDIRRSATGVPLVLEVNARVGANIRHAPEVYGAFLASLKGPEWSSSQPSFTLQAQ